MLIKNDLYEYVVSVLLKNKINSNRNISCSVHMYIYTYKIHMDRIH